MGESEDRVRARRVAARAQIQDVRLLSSHVETESLPGDGQLAFAIDVTQGQVDWAPRQTIFSIRCTYTVTLSEVVFEEDDDEDAPTELSRSIASIEFTLAGLFTLELRDGDPEPAED